MVDEGGTDRYESCSTEHVCGSIRCETYGCQAAQTPGREQDTSREADSPYRATRDGGQPGNAAPEPATTTATPTSASPAPGRGLDVCGCLLLADDQGAYAYCRECAGCGIEEGGRACAHCGGAGQHDVGGVVVSTSRPETADVPDCVAAIAKRTPRPWPDDSAPTVEQMADWLGVCSRRERIEFAEHARRDGDAARRCWEQNHEGRLAECERYRRLGQVVPGV